MKKVKSKRKIIIIVLIIFVLAFIAIKIILNGITSTVKQMTNTVQVETVERRDLSDFISLSGTTEGIQSTNITSKANAKVSSVNVSLGDEVAEGDVLCTFDSSKIKSQISSTKESIKNETAISENTKQQNQLALQDAQEAQQTELSSAQQSLNEAQGELDKVNQSLNEMRALLDTKRGELDAAEKALEKAQKYAKKHPNDKDAQTNYSYASEFLSSLQSEVEGLEQQIQELENSLPELSQAVSSAQTNYNGIKSSTDKTIRDAQNTIDMQKYQSSGSDLSDTLEDLEEQLEDCEILSPCCGVVTAVNISVGDNNTPGEVIFTIEDTSSMKINASVDEDDILRIEEGMKATITSSATKDKEWNGSVSRVVRVKNKSTNPSEETASTSGYAAEINIPDSELLVGMSAKVKIIIQEKKNVLAVPYDLIQTDEDGTTYVLSAVPQEDGSCMAVRCDVLTGDEVDYYTEILGGDLQEGDQIVYDLSVQEGNIFQPEIFQGEMDSSDESQDAATEVEE